jgi:hypothetical protein
MKEKYKRRNLKRFSTLNVSDGSGIMTHGNEVTH